MNKDVYDVLFEFLKQQENSALAAGKMSAMRHRSPEGGRDTIGYGHKLSAAEDDLGMVYGYELVEMTLEDAEDVLAEDIQEAVWRLQPKLLHQHNTDYEELSGRKQAMLIDYEFNVRGGISSFPKFVGAVINDAFVKQKEEYVRYYTDSSGRKRPLARNRAFYSTFMSPQAICRLGR